MTQGLDLADHTNAHALWNECGLTVGQHALWHLHWPVTGQEFWPKPWPYMTSTRSWPRVDKIFIIGQEGYLAATHHDPMMQDGRIYFWDSVVGMPHERARPYLFWFDWVKEVADQTHALIKLDHSVGQRSYVFDCLLGQSRPWRDWIYAQASRHPKMLVSYIGKTSWVPGTDLDGGQLIDSSNDQVRYRDDQWCNWSVLLPWRIYNQCWFSIVCETVMNQRFVTEKTAKALIGRRLFVWFGGHRGLHHLRKLGFKTFDNVIDEGYDDISDDRERLKAAWLQVEQLLDRDPALVFQEIQDRLIHNQNHIMQMDSRAEMVRQIQAIAQGALA